MTIDFSDVAKQVRGFYNSGFTTGIACAQVAYKCLTTPTDYPVNDGSFRSLKVIMPMGTVISAERPFPMRVWMTFPMTVIDTIFKALATAIPDRSIAGHHADLVFPNIHGISPEDGRLFIVGIGPLGGGWGAKSREDGVSATVCINDGDTHNSPTEQLEAKYPVLVESYRLREDSAGPGRQRGGLGAEMVVQALSPFSVTTRIDRVHCKPWGLDGGARCGRQRHRHPPERRVGRRTSRTPRFSMCGWRAATPTRCCSGGGGGFGDPVERDPELVAHDVREGYVSAAQATDAYRVALTAGGQVDVDATERRARRPSQRGGLRPWRRPHARFGRPAIAQELLDIWQRLSSQHVALAAGCACGIGGVTLRLQDFEQDIADYLLGAGRARTARRHRRLSAPPRLR